MRPINYIILGVAVIMLSFIIGIATIKITSKYRFKKTAYEMLDLVTTENHEIDLHKAAGLTSDDNVVFVDIRTPKEYDGFHIVNAINIPYERLLDDTFADLFKGEQVKVLYGNTSVGAYAAWMILTQFGYENVYVLNGGIGDWTTDVPGMDMSRDAYRKDEEALLNYEEVMGKN